MRENRLRVKIGKRHSVRPGSPLWWLMGVGLMALVYVFMCAGLAL